jgi:hypothetical protein
MKICIRKSQTKKDGRIIDQLEFGCNQVRHRKFWTNPVTPA